MKNLKLYNAGYKNPELVENVIDDYLLSDDISIEEYNKVVNLYNNYKMFFPLFEKYGNNKAKKLLDVYEDEIFTINGVVLNDKERIELALNELFIKIKGDNNTNMLDIIENLRSSNLDIDYVKKKISLLEASFGCNNKFLYSSYVAFIDCYRGILVNNLKLSDKYEFKRGL